jgi:non-canonical (house-cleaning) NTP pyrophosphatase
MKIAIGTLREPKVEAVKEAFELVKSQLISQDEAIEYLPFDAGGSSPHMPTSIKELMEGAQNRVESLILQLKKEKNEADFYVGMEGGFHVVQEGGKRMTFLQSWAYVADGHRGYFGSSGNILVPRKIANTVIDRGIELGIAIDRFAKETNIRSKQGTWGVLTRDILTRKHSFVIALICAFAPFYNRKAYE